MGSEFSLSVRENDTSKALIPCKKFVSAKQEHKPFRKLKENSIALLKYHASMHLR